MSGAKVGRRLADILATDVAGFSPHMADDEAHTLAWPAGIAHARCDVSYELGHIHDASGVDALSEVTALPLLPPARYIIAQDPDLVPRPAGEDYELVFAPPADASPAIEYLSPELALPITAIGVVEMKPGVRLVDTARERVTVTASGWQHF